MSGGNVVIVGGTGGLGRELARHYADQGQQVVIAGRDTDKASAVASELGPMVSGLGFDLSRPETIAPALEGIGPVDKLVLASIARDNNPVREYNLESALYLATMKLIGYTETVHSLIPELHPDSAVLLFGGRAKDWPYPGSTTVSSVNGGMSGLMRTLATELAPIRFNVIHPGVVGDSPFWENKDVDAWIARTLTGRLATMEDIVAACVTLLENKSLNCVELYVDGGTLLR